MRYSKVRRMLCRSLLFLFFFVSVKKVKVYCKKKPDTENVHVLLLGIVVEQEAQTRDQTVQQTEGEVIDTRTNQRDRQILVGRRYRKQHNAYTVKNNAVEYRVFSAQPAAEKNTRQEQEKWRKKFLYHLRQVIAVKNTIIVTSVTENIVDTSNRRFESFGIILFDLRFLRLRHFQLIGAQNRKLFLQKMNIFFDRFSTCCTPRIDKRKKARSEDRQRNEEQQKFLLPIVISEQIPEYKEYENMFGRKRYSRYD